MNENKRARRKRYGWILAVVIALAAAAYFVAGPALNRSEAQASVEMEQIASVFVGDLAVSVSASGEMVARHEARLAMGMAGRIEQVFVEEGDRVEAGDPLVRVETDALQRVVEKAEQNLLIQQATLEELLAGANEADSAAAQAALGSAEATLEKVLAGAEPADIAAAEASLDAARAAYQALLDAPDANSQAQSLARLQSAEAVLKQAQAEYDRVSWRTDIGALPHSTKLQQATTDYEAARVAYEDVAAGATVDQLAQGRANIAQAEANLQRLRESPTDAELASARAQLQTAQSNLTKLLDGATAERIAMAEAQVALARISLAEAQDNLRDATLVAPFAGVVTAVWVSEGELASGAVVELMDMDNLEIRLDVDEVDLAMLEVGQPAIITLESRPAVSMAGEVVVIAPRATQSPDATVSYGVRVRLMEPDPFIRPGMTVDAELVTANQAGVLLAPNAAISADRQAGRYYVHRLVGDADGTHVEKVEVTIGLCDASYTQITGGVAEGEQLLINSLSFADPSDGGLGFMSSTRDQMSSLRSR